MDRQIIHAEKAPAAVGLYSHAVVANGTVWCSGQIGLIPETGSLPEDFEAEVRQSFTNLGNVLQASGADFKDVVKFTLFITELDNFAKVNAVMGEFVAAPYPARSCVVVKALPKNARFEAEAVAVLPR